MKRNCYIEFGVLKNIADGYGVEAEQIEVDSGALAQVTGTQLSFIKSWTSAGLFGDRVRRVGNGTGTGTYWLYNLKSCVKIVYRLNFEREQKKNEIRKDKGRRRSST